MNKPFPLTIAGIVFTIVALIHLLGVVYVWPVTIADYSIPMSVSVIAFVVATLLAIWMFAARR